MHLLENYALSCGVKIGEPYIYESFFPLDFDKYITFHRDTNHQSRAYKYWQAVIDLLTPILDKHGIKILQVGTKKDKPLNRISNALGATNIGQLAFLIKNSMLHFGIDSMPVHFASFYNKKIVAIYSPSAPQNTGPFWGNPKDHKLIDSDKNGRKRCYSYTENPNSINNIRPEEIANSVLELLEISERINFTTVFIGENFGDNISSGFLPNKIVSSSSMIPEIRMDLLFNEEILEHQLKTQKCIITTNKPIRQDLITNLKQNIAKIIYLVEENDSPEFVKFLFENGILFDCVSKLSEEKIKDKKINYYRYCDIHSHIKTEQEKAIENLIKSSGGNYKFKNNYLLFSNGKTYVSESHLQKDENSENYLDFHSVNDSELFFSDLKNSWIVKFLY